MKDKDDSFMSIGKKQELDKKWAKEEQKIGN